MEFNGYIMLPLLSENTVMRIAKASVCGNEIDIDYVVKFIMDRYRRIATATNN